jgi:AcrR family transcriptional regulator
VKTEGSGFLADAPEVDVKISSVDQYGDPVTTRRTTSSAASSTGRRGRPSTPVLTQDVIVDTAWRLVREGRAFSVGGVARELGVHVSSLYNHIGSRDGLVNLLRERIAVAYPTDGLDQLTWQEALRLVATTHRRIYVDHPGLIQLFAQTPIASPRVLAAYTQLGHVFMRAGLSPTRAAQVIDLVDAVTLGAALGEPATDEEWPEDLPGGAALAAENARWESAAVRAEASFEAGIQTLIAGLEVELGR